MTFIVKKDPNAAKKAAMEAAKAAARPSQNPEAGAIMKYVKAELAAERIRVVFDDSGSMSSQIINAKQGVTEFFRNCVPNTTACAVHFLCTRTEESDMLGVLDTDLPRMAERLLKADLRLSGTPLFTTLKSVVEMTITTRIVAFTDGSPTDSLIPYDQRLQGLGTLEMWKKSADIPIAIAIERHIPIDTVFFGSDAHENEILLLKYISERTGGYFLHFDPAKVSFARAFKYLAPVNRKQLMSPKFRAELEAGKI